MPIQNLGNHQPSLIEGPAPPPGSEKLRLADKAKELANKLGINADEVSDINTAGIVDGFTHVQLLCTNYGLSLKSMLRVDNPCSVEQEIEKPRILYT